MKLTISPEEALRGKFYKTLAKLEAEIQEANSATLERMNYPPYVVKGRLLRLQEYFLKELDALSKQIEL